MFDGYDAVLEEVPSYYLPLVPIIFAQNGLVRSGMTSILIASAARYVANTSNLFINITDTNSQNTSSEQFTSPNSVINGSSPNKRQKVACHNPTAVAEPRVVFLDLEHGVHAMKLILFVREAVLRRWEETSLARKWRREQTATYTAKIACTDTPNQHHNEIDPIQEQRQIESAIAQCLGRIHVIQPRDFTHLSLVATIESLSKRLDDDKLDSNESTSNNTSRSAQQPPTLLIIDSLSTLDACARAQEHLPNISGNTSGSGLSERNEFYRQLQRLRTEHQVVVMASSRRVNSSECDSSGSIWDKMVTHRVGLHYVADGTGEQRRGFDFVATVKAVQDANMFPYSVTNGGINS